MKEIGQKILQKRVLKKRTVLAMLSILGRGLTVCRSHDSVVRDEMDTFPENFVFVLGIQSGRHPMVLQNRRQGLYRMHESLAAVCQKLPLPPSAVTRRFSANQDDPSMMLEIRFKSVEAGWRMITGQVSAAQAYARHDLLITGEIARAMQLLRCIERVEAYLLPKAIARRALPLKVKLPQARWQIWVRMLHAGQRKK